MKQKILKILAILAAIMFVIPMILLADQRYISDRLDLEFWTNRSSRYTYHNGDRVQIYFRTTEDCYVTIYNIDTDGNVRILFPYDSYYDGYVYAGRKYTIPDYGDEYDLVIHGPEGVGYIVAVASYEPFLLDGWRSAYGGRYHHTDYYDDDLAIDRIYGDPFIAMEKINYRLLNYQRDISYISDYVEYYVERRVYYPRYVCADCHGSYVHYNPYRTNCSVVDIFFYSDWHYRRHYYTNYYYEENNYYANTPRYFYRKKDFGKVVQGSQQHGGIKTWRNPGDIRGPGGKPLFYEPRNVGNQNDKKKSYSRDSDRGVIRIIGSDKVEKVYTKNSQKPRTYEIRRDDSNIKEKKTDLNRPSQKKLRYEPEPLVDRKVIKTKPGPKRLSNNNSARSQRYEENSSKKGNLDKTREIRIRRDTPKTSSKPSRWARVKTALTSLTNPGSRSSNTDSKPGSYKSSSKSRSIDKSSSRVKVTESQKGSGKSIVYRSKK